MGSFNNGFKIYVELRPCLVNGNKAMFHKWIVKEDIILKFHSSVNSETKKKIKFIFDETGTVDPLVSTEKIKSNWALVEYENGTVDMVNPINVRFIDTDNKMHGIYWEDYGGDRIETD